MAAQKKVCYPWDSWNEQVKKKQMRFLEVRFNRLDPTLVNRAIVSAPVISRKLVNGKYHKILAWHDVYIKADGAAYSSKGKRLENFDLSFVNYGEAE